MKANRRTHMIHHPAPSVLAKNLRQLADRLDDIGTHKPACCRCIRCRAQTLAARGWPATTNGTDGGRSSDPTTSTERAALNPGPYDDIDNRLAQQLQAAWHCCLELHASIDMILAHANDDDPVPAGTGRCLRCDKFVRPDGKHPHNRIQAGWCPACYRKWARDGRPDRSWFIRNPDEETAA